MSQNHASQVRKGSLVAADADVASIGALLADRSRCQILFTLLDGRALPASTLAAEAGVAASTASGHLRQLTDSGMLSVEKHGRHRYYRLTGAEIVELLEAAARVAPRRPVTSLKAGTRAAALRAARSCYDHLAGRLGVALMGELLRQGYLTGHDGSYDPAAVHADRLAGPGRDHSYLLAPAGREFLAGFGVTVTAGSPVRYCVDWSEQRHHVAGELGRGLLARLLELAWVSRAPAGRWLRVSPAGVEGFSRVFGLSPQEWQVA